MGKEVTILKGSSGLNNVVDPVRLRFDPETGIAELKAAVNVEIDESYRINRMKGSTLLTELAGAHSLFSYRDDCFVAAGGNLFRVNDDYTLLGLRAGMNISAKLSYAGMGDKIFYTNGYEQGVIDLFGVSYPWLKSEYQGPLDTHRYYDPPVGHLLMSAHSKMFIAQGDTIWHSEPFTHSLFRMKQGYYQFGSRVTMMAPVDEGFYVGDQEGVYFVDLEDNKRQVTKSRPFVGSSETFPNGTIPKLEMAGSVVFWSASDGLWFGSSAGQVINVTENNLVFPEGYTDGATVLREDGFIMTAMM